MNRNKEYRLKRKSLRKDYIIQDKNLTIKTLYYRNETKRNKIDQLQQENKQLKADLTKEELAYSNLRDTYNKKYNECKLYKEVIEEVREYIKGLEDNVRDPLYEIGINIKAELLQILDKVGE